MREAGHSQAAELIPAMTVLFHAGLILSCRGRGVICSVIGDVLLTNTSVCSRLPLGSHFTLLFSSIYTEIQ